MIVTGPDIVAWCEKRTGGYGFDNPIGFGIIRSDKLVGAAVFDNWRPAAKQICVSIALDSKYALSYKVLQRLFDYPFNQLQCKRLAAMIEVCNTPSMNLCRSLGFVQEGMLRQASPTGKDLAIFGMLNSECKWLKSQNTSNT